MLVEKCDEVFRTYELTSELEQSIEHETRKQAKRKFWFQQRARRVTASRLRSVICSDVAQPSQSFIKSICYLENACFKSKATS